jgi:hypothetical protein
MTSEPTAEQMAAFNRLMRDRIDKITTALIFSGPGLLPTVPIDVGRPEIDRQTINVADFSRWGDGPDSTLGVDMLREMADMLAKAAPPPLPEFNVVPADRQCRTARDVPAGTRRTSPRPPAKAKGRRGTRKAWKRRHPPRTVQMFTYREPVDVLVLAGSAREPWGDYWPGDDSGMSVKVRYRPPPPDLWIVTPLQMETINRKLAEAKA